MKRIEPYLAHIQDAIKAIQNYTKGVDFETFSKDQKTQDAVIRRLEVIGEASSKLTAHFVKDNPQVPWRVIKDFRNKLIHDYWELDLELIWNVIQQDIPELQKKMKSLRS
jgi:uncharacterized protein with HEPN domain